MVNIQMSSQGITAVLLSWIVKINSKVSTPKKTKSTVKSDKQKKEKPG